MALSTRLPDADLVVALLPREPSSAMRICAAFIEETCTMTLLNACLRLESRQMLDGNVQRAIDSLVVLIHFLLDLHDPRHHVLAQVTDLAPVTWIGSNRFYVVH